MVSLFLSHSCLAPDYRLLAASTMYQRARKLAQLAGNSPDHFIKLAELQLEAYVVSINALSLIDQKSAWLVLPVSVESGNEVRACVGERLNF